jgi:adenine deaminase
VNTKGLAESIILQSLEDLWSRNHRKDSENFFTGDTFCLCADIAEMNDLDQIKMRHMVKKVLKRVRRPMKNLKMEKKSA